MTLPGYDKSLESELVKHPNAHECFELAIAVITTMCELNTAFPSLVFPDIKPSNFLVVSSVTGGRAAPRSVVLTDLGYAREEGAPVTLGSWPYQQCKRGEPSQHAFERFATLVTLLQIMLGMSSEDVLHWGTPTGTSLMDAINLLSDVRELKATAILRPEVEDGEIGKEILPNLKNIFHSLLGPTANIPSYDEIKSSLECVILPLEPRICRICLPMLLVPHAPFLPSPPPGAYGSSSASGPVQR